MAVVTAAGAPAVNPLCALYAKADFHGKLSVATTLARIGGKSAIECLLRVLPDEPPGGDGVLKDDVPIIDGAGGRIEQIARSLGVALVIVALDDMRAAAALYPQLKRLRCELFY